ncbi:hypothetical protein CEXT_51211 [Caerostris extrusa]|uniref:Uncharacterized protein n=1 Tax=Caerostris extrusa TaxID=172846 RepID=A0AAV4RPT7_CAEEX|nr:hypothetical protein CEXT_51211 [Caerostris extrusa]
MSSRNLTISACFVVLSLLAYTKADFNLREEDVNGLNRNSEENENACECTGGKCVTEKGKQVCKCPPEYGVASGKSCKACECGEGSNCTFTCKNWFCLSYTKNASAKKDIK